MKILKKIPQALFSAFRARCQKAYYDGHKDKVVYTSSVLFGNNILHLTRLFVQICK